LGSAIILPGLPERFEKIRFLARYLEQSGAGEVGRTLSVKREVEEDWDGYRKGGSR
jgi:hypothetical protein